MKMYMHGYSVRERKDMSHTHARAHTHTHMHASTHARKDAQPCMHPCRTTHTVNARTWTCACIHLRDSQLKKHCNTRGSEKQEHLKRLELQRERCT